MEFKVNYFSNLQLRPKRLYQNINYTEDNTTNNSYYKTTTFSDYMSNGDETTVNRFDKIYKNPNGAFLGDINISWHDDMFYGYAFREPRDRSHERGKILTEKFYSSNDELLKEIEYNYERSQFANYHAFDYCSIYINNPALISGTFFGRYSQVNRYSFLTHNLVEKSEIDYDQDSGEKIISIQKYNYDDDKLYLKETINTTSNGEVNKQILTYSFELDKEPYNTMKEHGIVSPIVKIENKKEINKKEILLSTVQNNYVIKPNLAPALSNIIMPIIESTEVSIAGNESETRVEYAKHDKYGNPLHIIKDGGEHTVYLWGYSNKYPIAEIRNATYATIEQLLGQTLIERIASASTPSDVDWLAINNLRKNDKELSGIFISTYTYKPQIGILTATDPSGIITYYKYDESGRLEEIYLIENNVKKILNVNQYHYVNE